MICQDSPVHKDVYRLWDKTELVTYLHPFPFLRKYFPVRYNNASYTVSAVDTWIVSPSNPVFCSAEDTNQNGQLDAGEDTNTTGKLEPTNSATTSASSITSAADGSADFALLYPQSHCNWVRVELTATVRVGGSESVETSEFFLSCLASAPKNTHTPSPGGT